MAVLFCIIVCVLQLMLEACSACKWWCSLCYSLLICNCGESLAVASGNKPGLNAHDLECVVNFWKDIPLALPVGNVSVGLLGGRTSVDGSCGL